MSHSLRISVVVMISATVEWKVIRTFYPDAQTLPSHFGEWFVIDLDSGERVEPVLFFHGGWEKSQQQLRLNMSLTTGLPGC